MNVNTVNRLYAGTVVGVSGLTPQLVANLELINNVILVASSANQSPLYLGGSTMTVANSFPLYPSEKITLHVDNLNLVYAMSESGKSNNFSYIGC